jgi:translation initiation factor IF-3
MGADSTSAAPPASLDVLAHAVIGAAGVKAGVAEMRATLQLPAKQQADLVLPT